MSEQVIDDQQPQMPEMHIHMPDTTTLARDNHNGRRTAIKLGAGVVIGAVLFHGCDPNGIDHFDGAPHVTASVAHNTLTTQHIAISCDSKDNEYVGVHGEEHFTALGGTSGGQKVDKLYYGSFLNCGDDNQITSTAIVDRSAKGRSFVVGILPVPEIEGATPAFLSAQNCVPLRVADAKKPAIIVKKINTYNQEIAKADTEAEAGDTSPNYPSCDTGVHNVAIQANLGFMHQSTGFDLDPKDGEGQAAVTAAQLALALDPYSDPQEQQALDSLKQVEKLQLEADYPGYQVSVIEPLIKPTDTQIIEDRLAHVAEENPGIGAEFEAIDFSEEKDGTVEMVATSGDGETIKVDMSGQTISVSKLESLNSDVAKVLTANRTVPNPTYASVSQ